jgi:hypothetical protein
MIPDYELEGFTINGYNFVDALIVGGWLKGKFNYSKNCVVCPLYRS